MEHKFELAKGAQKNKERQQDIDMTRLRNSSSKAELRARAQDLKEARANIVEDKNQKVLDEAMRIQTLAAAACARIAK